MASSRHKKNKGPDPFSSEPIRKLLQAGKYRRALDLAKAHHKAAGTSESEGLLVEAYRGRIQELAERGMTEEARALGHTVLARYPRARAVLAEFDAALGNWDALVARLLSPDLSPEQRAAVDRAILQELLDPGQLAACRSLPPDHPLRQGAAAIAEALAAVTAGPVPGIPALTEVSMRSPLAPWKLLVRAIAHFYRGEDEDSESCLQRMVPESAPARLVPALRALIRSTALPAGAVGLEAAGGRSRRELRTALEQLDRSFSGSRTALARAIRAAVMACQRTSPELLGALRQRIEIRSDAFSWDVLSGLTGGPARRDAAFWRLLALVREEQNPLEACGFWEEFRLHALHQGWFQERSPEAAALYLRMAGLLERYSPEALEDERYEFMAVFEELDDLYEDQPPSVRRAVARRERPFYYLDVQELYRLACSCDPHSEAFERWLESARRESGWQPADRVAEAWHQACPQDVRPLLFRMESAEQRGALQKALEYLARALAIDAVEPRVTRARLRLSAAAVVRALRQKKLRQAGKHLRELESLPAFHPVEQRALLAVLGYGLSILSGNPQEAGDRLKDAGRFLGGDMAAQVAVAGLAGIPVERPRLSRSPGELTRVAARVCALGEIVGLALEFSTTWWEQLVRDVEVCHEPPPLPGLRALAETALRGGFARVVYGLAALTLRQEDPLAQAHGLLLRARCLPTEELARQVWCVAAAAELARRQGEHALIAEAVAVLQQRPGDAWMAPVRPESLTLDSERLADVLRQERALEFGAKALCQCSNCRRERELQGRPPRKRGRSPARRRADEDSVRQEMLF
ncbi:MAG: hypothetical protein HY319_00295 [Armatimonadetes bacterium]|nr:hypothetical protein [Armatimonadota bacterium]